VILLCDKYHIMSKIVILGAGVAGHTAAAYLQKNLSKNG